MTIDEKICCYCKKPEDDMRPYGPSGDWVCFECATETPERDAETNAVFGAELAANMALSGGAVMLNVETGDMIPMRLEDMKNISFHDMMEMLINQARERDG